MNRTLHTLAVASLVLFAGCSAKIKDSNINTPLINGALAIPVQPEANPLYVRQINPDRETANIKVSANAPDVALGELFSTVLPGTPIEPQDVGVDLRRRLSISVNAMPLPDFLDYLASRTNYDYQVRLAGDKPIIRVFSVGSRTWNLASLASNRKSVSKVGQSGSGSQSGGGAGGGGAGGSAGFAAGAGGSTGGAASQARRSTEVTVNTDEDEWDSTIRQLRAILQANEGAETAPSPTEVVDPLKPKKIRSSLIATRLTGIVQASGDPSLIRQADEFIKETKKFAGRTVYLSLAIHEVTLRDTKSTGIQWQVLSDGFSGNTRTGVNASGTFPSAANVTNAGALTINAFAALRDDSINLLLSFLAQFGSVNLLTQPNITVNNGRSASLSSGQEFSYVESVISNTTSQGTTTITPVLARILVGTEFSITPRILDDDRISMDIVPVISSVLNFQDFTVGDTTFSTPNIAINELATQVIVRSGQTIHVGGLITERLQETVNRLPFREGSFADYLFRSDTNQLERRELVLTITPRLI